MHDIRAIRENPAAFDAALARRGDAGVSSDILALDEARRDTAEPVRVRESMFTHSQMIEIHTSLIFS